MIVRLELDTENGTDAYTLKLFQNADKMALALFEVRHRIRNTIKYELDAAPDLTDSERDLIISHLDDIRSIINDLGIDEELI